MAKPTLPVLQTTPASFSVMFHRITGGAWEALGQVKNINVTSSGATEEVGRIGDPVNVEIASNVKHALDMEVYMQLNLSEQGRLLGYVRPGGGWLGTETIQVQPDVIIGDFKEEQYHTSGATPNSPVSIRYFIGVRITSFNEALSFDQKARSVKLTGTAQQVYRTGRTGAGTGA